MKLARDTWLVFQRQMTLLLRSKIWIIIGLAQPITYVLFFTPFLKPALASMGVKDYGDAFRNNQDTWNSRATSRDRARFRSLDRNQDNRLSLLEWTGSNLTFDRLDRNRDGVLSPNEWPK